MAADEFDLAHEFATEHDRSDGALEGLEREVRRAMAESDSPDVRYHGRQALQFLEAERERK